MLLVLNFEKLNVWTPQIHRPRCYYITRKFFMQAEKSRSGASSFFPVENILIHTVLNAKGWNKRLMLLYHAALFHANRKPPISARRPTAPCERISESTSTSTPKKYENKFRNHYCYAITICFWLWSKSSKAACELALTTMDWFLSLHHQEMPPRLLLWIWIIEYLYPNHYVNILPRRNNSRKQKAPCDKHDAFRNSFFTWKTSSRPKPPCTAGSMLRGTYLRRRCRTRTDAHGVSCRALTTIKPFPERFAPSFRDYVPAIAPLSANWE